MARFSVVLNISARKELDALDNVLLERIITKLEALADEPRPAGCQKLRGAQDLWRIRAGEYRIIYAIDAKSRHIDLRASAIGAMCMNVNATHLAMSLAPLASWSGMPEDAHPFCLLSDVTYDNNTNLKTATNKAGGINGRENHA